jgi:hypothetical protein
VSSDIHAPGGKDAARTMIDASKAAVTAAIADDLQLDMLDPITPEEMVEAQEDLGPNAGQLAVVRHARAKRQGRPQGSKNRRTDDFEKYISQFGSDPAVALTRIHSSTPEMLVERSRQLDPVKRRLSYGDAQNMIIRAAEAMMPYRHSKKPVAADLNIRGVMVVEEIGRGAPRSGVTIDGEVIRVATDGEIDT